jgi:urea transport system permease protein
MFLGYDPLWYKLAAFTLSAVLCGIAGALYVPQVGIINPGEMSPANSIEIAIWVAVGGRGTLTGAVAGAFLVNLAKSWFTVRFPEYWLFFLGGLFVLVTLYLPHGVVGIARQLRERRTTTPTPPEGAQFAPRDGPSARRTTPTPPEGAQFAPRDGPSARTQ